jgi:hypothetical protein
MATQKSVKSLQAEISKLNKIIHTLNQKYTFKYEKNRPIMIVQIGDAATGWIGDPESVAFLIRELKQARVDDTHNIVIYHYAAKFTIVPASGLRRTFP